MPSLEDVAQLELDAKAAILERLIAAAAGGGSADSVIGLAEAYAAIGGIWASRG
jgi:hypothetical protein